MKAACKLLLSLIFCLPVLPSSAQAPYFQWAAGIVAGTGASVNVQAIATGTDGHVYCTGIFDGTTTFRSVGGSRSLTTSAAKAFVAKLSTAGRLIWIKAFTAEGVYGLAVDAAGNVYTTGNFAGTGDFDPGSGVYNITAAGVYDAFVSKLDSSGAFVWAKAFGGSGSEYGQGIALDNAGNVYTAGQFDGPTDFDPGSGTVTLTPVNGDAFVAKLDRNGAYVWAKDLGGAGWDGATALAVDAGSGAVYITGAFTGTADFDPGTGTANQTAVGGADAFISKLDPGGNYLWAVSFGGPSLDDGAALAVDNGGNIYSTGSFTGDVDFDPGPGSAVLSTSNAAGAYVLKLTANGGYSWARAVSDPAASVFSFAIAVDSSRNVYTSGYYNGTADFDPGSGSASLVSSGADVFVSKLDATGGFVWAKGLGTPVLGDYAYAIAVDARNNLYVGGYTADSADFDPGAGASYLGSKSPAGFLFKWSDGSPTATVGNYLSPARFSIFPQPAHNQLNIRCEDQTLFGRYASLYNAQGKTVVTCPLGSATCMELDHLSCGMYFLSLPDGKVVPVIRE